MTSSLEASKLQAEACTAAEAVTRVKLKRGYLAGLTDGPKFALYRIEAS